MALLEEWLLELVQKHSRVTKRQLTPWMRNSEKYGTKEMKEMQLKAKLKMI